MSTLLKLLQTERNNISKYKNQKGENPNYVSYPSLGFNFLPSCLKAITVASCQNRHGNRIHVLCSSRRPHHSISNGARLPPGFSPSFHTTSGAVGLAPSSGGGLRRRTLQHISETSPQDEDRVRWQVCIWAARDVRHALTSVHNSAGCKRAPFHFLWEKGWCSVLCCCVWWGMGALVPEDDDALQHGKSLLLWSHLGTGTVVIHGYFAHVLAGLL